MTTFTFFDAVTCVGVTFVAGSAVFGADDPARAIEALRSGAARHTHSH